MIRIVALNDEAQNYEENEDEIQIQVTKEAEESIAVSEYMRALSLKSKGKNENALTLLQELLETRVLNEISLEDKTDTLFCIRYNCHKNIALIYEEKGQYDIALEYYLNAMSLDDSEVYIMNRLGQLTLKLKKWELAQHAFQKCLARNPNHWPAADGILQVLCSTENILGAYGWAMKWYTKDENYKRAIQVLLEITERFENLIPFFESVYKCSFKLPESIKEDYKLKNKSVFPIHDKNIEYVIERTVKPDICAFRQDNLNWLTIGKFIISVYNYCGETKQSIIFLLDIEDIAQSENDTTGNRIMEKKDKLFNENGVMDNEITIGKEIQNNDVKDENFIAPSTGITNNNTGICELLSLSDPNADDLDNQKLESEPTKPKPRRRCSDLSFLEQWGWHKNRRYSSRKKSQQDRVEVDTTLNGFLRRIFIKYFEENFDHKSPFLADIKVVENINKREERERKLEDIQISFDKFQKNSEEDFQRFLEELKSKNFDLIRLMFLWLKYVSKYWNEPITEEMTTLYHSIYEFYLNHYDLLTWNQLSNDNFNASYRMALFFMELDYEILCADSKNQTRSEIDPRWKMLYYHLQFNSGCAYVTTDEIYEKNIIRLMWLDYLSAKYENDLNRSVECLLFLETLIDKQQEENNFNLFLPNLQHNNNINMEFIRNTRINLQRKISLSNVKNLYESNKFEDLTEILKDSLINSTEIKNSDNTVMKIQTQFEVLLESFWNLEKYEECLIWSERCLKHGVDNLLLAPANTYRYKEWTESINFILIYIEELILLESYEILTCLEKYLSRMVQSLVKILVHQLDSPFDKSNNPPHPINIKRPWVILHQVLQRIEDHSPVIIKQKPSELALEVEDIEEILPHTILILFTAHEFLGRRQWCTRDNGQLLLYTLSNVASKLRAPFMDGYRDLVSEYLEQITYCLYGYPPKKARSRHIEEHDATPVELTWIRSIQLFDIYRPENLPEFNSYKLDSISADMEQLLLKIVPLIPKENDPSQFTANIKDFITGKLEELPQDCGLLPHRIKCLYYLLADYYFKNRDFSKTIKFYTLDLTCEPTRFDSWAGLALSKASKLETKLNSCLPINVNEFLAQTEEAKKCFEQCILLNKDHTLLWIEYGSFAYIIHSFCSRSLKNPADTFSIEQFAFIEQRREKYLNISYDCFAFADKNIKTVHEDVTNEDSEYHDEKWLHHYMLGKIAEKRKEHPKVFLDHYLMAANFLYENNATYPIKINHNTPSTFSIEALEIFYRTTSAIIKYVEQHSVIEREIGRLFTRVLKQLANSPFAYNQAKIDDNSINALKRKLAEKAEINKNKQQKVDLTEIQNLTWNKLPQQLQPQPPSSSLIEKIQAIPHPLSSVENTYNTKEDNKTTSQSRSRTLSNAADNKPTSPSRRGSQESTVTTVTSTTGTGTSSSTSSSSESDSSSSNTSSSESDSASEDSDDEKSDDNSPLSENELEPIYKNCVRNLEECITRFSEHYKSIYRLVNHYLNAPTKLRDIEKCKQLLLGTYKTNLGNLIVGLFSDRKNNNFFNGIWRIPSPEIDRPGGFSSHLVKCVAVLLEVLRKSGDHKILIDMALQLHRTPDNDKRYIKDSERKELYQQAITFCAQIMREILKQNMEKRNDVEILNLMIDVYKVHKKCIKHMNDKETIFSQLLVDVYKFYIENKVAKLPETSSLIDLAVRLCLQEISSRKNQQKQTVNVATMSSVQGKPFTVSPNSADMMTTSAVHRIVNSTITHSTTYPIPKQIPIPGIPRPRGRPVGSKNASSTSSNQNQSPPSFTNLPLFDSNSIASVMSLYGNSALGTKESTYFQKLVAEYYKILAGPSLFNSLASTLPNLASPITSPIINPLSQTPTSKSLQMTSSAVSSGSSIPISSVSPKIPLAVPQFDIKNLIASAASQVAKSSGGSQSSSATISVGTGQLTITPTMSKSSIPTTYSQTPSQESQSKSSTSISVIKVPTSSPSLSVKPLSELTGPKPISIPSIPILPDLPKSLTITPAPLIASDKPKLIQSQAPQVSLISDIGIDATKMTGKVKGPKKSKVLTTPYSKISQQQTTSSPFISSLSTASQFANLNSLAQQLPFLNNINLQNYNSQVALLNTYAELMKIGVNPNATLLSQNINLPQFQIPTQKRPYTKRGRHQKLNIPNLTMQQPSGISTDISASSIPIPGQNVSAGPIKSKSQTFVPSSFGIPLSKSPILSSSPNQSPLSNVSVLSPRSSVTPPILATHTSPTKTLQQKLAEKQKANALNESSLKAAANSSSSSSAGGVQKDKSNKKKDGLDVIVLD